MAGSMASLCNSLYVGLNMVIALALLLLAAASWAQDDSLGWHVRGLRPNGRERPMALEADTASFRLRAGEAYHPAFQAEDGLDFQARVLVRRGGRYRFGLDLTGAEGTLRARSKASTACSALPFMT